MIYFERISKEIVPERHPILAFDAFWRSATKDGKSVCWNDFTPMNMPGVLPWFLVFGCLPDNEYLIRLSGTGLDRILKKTLTGSIFGEHMDERWAKSRKEDLDAVKSGSGPLYAKGDLPVEDRVHIRVFRGLYGFTNGGDDIVKLVAVIAPPNGRHDLP